MTHPFVRFWLTLATVCVMFLPAHAQTTGESEQERAARRINKALDRQNAANKDVRRNAALNSDGSGRLPPLGPERYCEGLKKFGAKNKPVTECPMSQEAFCALIYAQIERHKRSSSAGTICPPKGQ